MFSLLRWVDIGERVLREELTVLGLLGGDGGEISVPRYLGSLERSSMLSC